MIIDISIFLQNFAVSYDLKKRIDYREYSDLDVFTFLKEEFNNHTSKLIGSDTQFKKWIENFISYLISTQIQKC